MELLRWIQILILVCINIGIEFDVSGSVLLSDDNGFCYNIWWRYGPTQGLDNTKLNAEKEYSINFNEQQKIFCLSLHSNRVNHDLFVNCVETFKLKARDSEINSTPSFLGNVLKDFSDINLKKTVLYGYFYDFSVDYDSNSNVIRTPQPLSS